MNRTGPWHVVPGMSTVTTVARGLTAAAVLLSAVIHLDLWLLGVRTSALGPAFLLNAVGGLVVALAVLVWRSALPLLAAMAFGAATLGAYVLSLTVGLAGVRNEWGDPLATAAAVAEAAAVLLALGALVTEHRGRTGVRGGRRARPA